MSYEASKRLAEPYIEIVEELPQMRRETRQLVRQAVSEGRRAFADSNFRPGDTAMLIVERRIR